MNRVAYTINWYGFYPFPNWVVKQRFLKNIRNIKRVFLYDIEQLYRINTDVTSDDLMIKILENDSDQYKRNFNTKCYLLAIASYVCEVDGCLSFSDFNKKNYFYQEIDKIVCDVVAETKANIAKEFLISVFCIFIPFVYAGYQFAQFLSG